MSNGNEDKTIYTFNDWEGKRSKITLPKFTSDGLQDQVPDVHFWVQTQYDLIIKGQHKFSKSATRLRSGNESLSRRAIGDVIREYGFQMVLDTIEDL